jgi:hypothetical protein
MTDSYEKNLYDQLRSWDVLSMLEPAIDGFHRYLRPEDGKIKNHQVTIPMGTPWVHVKTHRNLDCGLWNHLIFKQVVPQLPSGQRFVPRGCQSCWKVVVKPRTLQQLFALLKIQKDLDIPAKCGIEQRMTTHGLYGGYFYNTSLPVGLKCYEVVKGAMLESEIMAPLVEEVDSHGKTTRILLKRACTEMEHAMGDSDKWEITPEQEFLEDLIKSYVVSENIRTHQPEHLVWNIQRRWIEFAYTSGDPTYALYTGGKPIYPPYVTYHQPELLKPEGAE